MVLYGCVIVKSNKKYIYFVILEQTNKERKTKSVTKEFLRRD